jgi:hypothetical protein
MKTISFSVVLLVASLQSIAQIRNDGPLPGPSPQTPGIIDGVVFRGDGIVSQEKMECSHVRDADYTWSKRVFSRIDARENMNHTIFFPYDYFLNSNSENWTPPKDLKEISKKDWQRHDERWSLWTIIVQHIMMGDLTVYLTEPDKDNFASGNKLLEDGYSFKYPIIKNTPDAYFKDASYRKKINRVLSSGPKSGLEFSKITLLDDTEWSLKKGLDPTESFDAWYNRLITEGEITPAYQIKPEDFWQLKEFKIEDSKKLEDAFSNTSSGQILRSPPEVKFISSASITAYNIKEDWYFDKNRSKLEQRIIGIAPVGRFNTDTTDVGYFDRSKSFIFKSNEGKLVDANNEEITDSVVLNEKEMFWLYFDELRDVLVNYYVYNEKSDAQQDSFDDLFIQRRFSSTAYKTSDKFDREIEDYKFGVDRLYEAERIKEEIRKWEQDVWNY